MSDILKRLEWAKRNARGLFVTEIEELLGDAIAELSAIRDAQVGADVRAGWRPIEEVEGSSDTFLLYHPPCPSGRLTLPAMMSVGRPGDKPMRPPSHYMPLPEPPSSIGVNVGVNAP